MRTHEFTATFPITDRDVTVAELKQEARGAAWRFLGEHGCFPAGTSTLTVNHEAGTITFSAPVDASASNLPSNAPITL